MQLSTQNRIAIFLFSLLLAVVMCSLPLYAADETGYTFRSSANEVRLAFAASDHQGQVIKTLVSSDVAVADNDSIIRHFRSFRSASESPLDLVVLLDASDSVASQIPAEIAEVKTFIEGSTWGERDRVSILAFGGLRPMLICARNCTGDATWVKLEGLRASGATPLYDALFQAAEILRQDHDPESRSAMILFSDGSDTISLHGISDVTEAAQNLESAIYSVDSSSKKTGSSKGGEVLEYLAANTGGRSFALGQKLPQVLRMIVEDLRGGYVLTYEAPAQTIGQHSVRILPTSNPRLQFRARAAYNDSIDK